MVRKFVGKGGCPDVGVRGSGVEGGLRPVPRGRPAKKKNTTTTTLFIQSRRKRENGPKSNGFITFCIPLIIRSRRQAEKVQKSNGFITFCCVGLIHFAPTPTRAHAHPPPRPPAPIPLPRFLPTSLDGSNVIKFNANNNLNPNTF